MRARETKKTEQCLNVLYFWLWRFPRKKKSIWAFYRCHLTGAWNSISFQIQHRNYLVGHTNHLTISIVRGDVWVCVFRIGRAWLHLSEKAWNYSISAKLSNLPPAFCKWHQTNLCWQINVMHLNFNQHPVLQRLKRMFLHKCQLMSSLWSQNCEEMKQKQWLMKLGLFLDHSDLLHTVQWKFASIFERGTVFYTQET